MAKILVPIESGCQVFDEAGGISFELEGRQIMALSQSSMYRHA